ncbi:hypothetical protein E4H12_09695 [Candidatus Thorarchaeota archaeon]|nr:MAG: hypothetical protein E4H12_09695 [Candidatus Thorarchaeota archaeon]
MKKPLRKGAYFTDIHFGKKANSHIHNDDCLHFIDWFCEQVKSDPTIDYIAFLGDWNENRSALNIATLDYSYRGAKKINELGKPVFFCVGNHDLYHRHTRELYSVVPFKEFNNFTVIDQPMICKDIADGVMFSPYMFHDEYPSLVNYLKIPFWAGHFEFKGFQVTGYNIVMPTGPDPTEFAGPKHIVSGHFHRRQANLNVVYMGNTFPMDFGDAGDNDRGMMTYDHTDDKMEFINWDQCPRYIKAKLTDILDNTVTIYPEARVRCVVDVPISFEESTYLRQKFVEDYSLREFNLEESKDIAATITGTQTSIDIENTKLDSVDDLVVQMLNDIDSDHFDNHLLIETYQRIRL